MGMSARVVSKAKTCAVQRHTYGRVGAAHAALVVCWPPRAEGNEGRCVIHRGVDGSDTRVKGVSTSDPMRGSVTLQAFGPAPDTRWPLDHGDW
jgi:hypothetical protein